MLRAIERGRRFPDRVDRPLDAAIHRQARGLLQDEVARDRRRRIGRAHQRDAGQGQRNHDEKRDEEDDPSPAMPRRAHAAGGMPSVRVRLHGAFQSALRNGIVVSSTL
jgi:hypothetical protein